MRGLVTGLAVRLLAGQRVEGEFESREMEVDNVRKVARTHRKGPAEEPAHEASYHRFGAPTGETSTRLKNAYASETI